MILHANSSLPRSGSELLQALLGQHPDVYASATSPLLEYWFAAQGNTQLPEAKSQPQDLMREAFRRFCRAGAHGYYSALTDRPVIVDKSRGWMQYGELLWDAFPGAKIVCMVRRVEDIIDSLERVYRANAGHPETRSLPRTPEQRAEAWLASGAHPLGLALDRIRDRQARGHDERIAYVEYEHLVSAPVDIMRQVFNHLGLDPFDVDPNNVTKSAPEDDQHFGIFGTHSVRPVVGRRTA